MSERKNLIMGAAVGYNVEHVRNFIVSARSVNQKDKIVLILDIATRDRLLPILNEYNVEPLVYSGFNFIDTHVNTIRWLVILDYLYNQDPNSIGSILLIDVRDAIFQHDPFADLPENFLYFFSEDNGMPIRKQSCNARWMQVFYGHEEYEQVKDLPILCLGTIMGSRNMILDYVSRVYNELLALKTHRFDMFKIEISDQAIGMHIAYYHYGQSLEIKRNGDIVGTLHSTIMEPEHTDVLTMHMGKLLVNGVAPAVIHQYDRSPTLTDYFNKKYAINMLV